MNYPLGAKQDKNAPFNEKESSIDIDILNDEIVVLIDGDIHYIDEWYIYNDLLPGKYLDEEIEKLEANNNDVKVTFKGVGLTYIISEHTLVEFVNNR